jgi:LuxR family maltose regulon positive regulatory protein
LLLGNVDETILYARRVLDLAPEDDFLRRGGAAALQGLALWTNGDLASGQRLYAESFTWLKRARYISDSLGCSLALADIVLAQGRLHEAMRFYERGLQLAAEHGAPEMRGTADMLVGMSELYREQNDLTTAAQYLQRSQQQGESTGLPQNRYRWRVAMAGIQQAQGDLDSALDLLNEAERLYVGDFSPNVRPVAAMTARVWVAQGRLGEALDWARERGLSAEDNLTYLREFEHITLARILMAQYQRNQPESSIHKAIALLERLLQAAQAGGRVGSEIEILLLQALAQQMRDDIPAALSSLDRALTLAEPEGYVRIFVGEGLSMAKLLQEAATHKATSRRGLPDYVSKLLAAFGTERPTDADPSPLLDRQSQPAQAAQHLIEPAAQLAPKVQPAQDLLIEPLSQRELEILRLFKTELSGPEIAQELMIALSTVRTHTNNIYSKLNVKHRRAAVKQAIELRLI